MKLQRLCQRLARKGRSRRSIASATFGTPSPSESRQGAKMASAQTGALGNRNHGEILEEHPCLGPREAIVRCTEAERYVGGHEFSDEGFCWLSARLYVGKSGQLSERPLPYAAHTPRGSYRIWSKCHLCALPPVSGVWGICLGLRAEYLGQCAHAGTTAIPCITLNALFDPRARPRRPPTGCARRCSAICVACCVVKA